MSKIIVTGGAGFIGSHLTDKLIEKGHQVVVIDNLSTGNKNNVNPKADFFNLDICDFEKIKPLFKGVDFVFHLAALARVPLSIEDPINTSKTNILGTINVFKAAADEKVKRIVFASSSSVYGNQEIMPLMEDMDCLPVSPYALQKITGERFARLFSDIYKTPIVSLRYFNVYGPRLNFDSEYSLVIGKFLKQKKEGKPLTIFDDGEQSRGFCYVDDVNEANIKAMESEKIKGGEVINIGSDKPSSINYLAELIGGLPAPPARVTAGGQPNTFYVYAVKCDNDSLYIGQTENLRQRWQEHIKGTAANWTKKHKPLYIAHYEEYSTREDAVRREQELKTGFGRKWLKREIEVGRARQAGKVKYFPPRAGDIRNSQADLSLAKKLLNWYPKITFEQGLEKVKEWFNKNYNN